MKWTTVAFWMWPPQVAAAMMALVENGHPDHAATFGAWAIVVPGIALGVASGRTRRNLEANQ